MRKGFTLIEMLVVIAVLGVLVATLLTVINPLTQIEKANDAHRKNDLEQIQRALELYYQDNGSYPASLSFGNSWNPYMTMVPKDPSSGYYYVYFSTGQTYYLYAHLERGANDPQTCAGGNACSGFSRSIPGFPSSSACGKTCNYGVTSPNDSP